MGALYSLKEFGTGVEIEQRWFPKMLDPADFVGDPNNPAGKPYMELLDGNAPPPVDPNDELDDAIRAVNTDGITDLVTKAAIDGMKTALIGRARHRGKP